MDCLRDFQWVVNAMPFLSVSHFLGEKEEKKIILHITYSNVFVKSDCLYVFLLGSFFLSTFMTYCFGLIHQKTFGFFLVLIAAIL